MAQQSPLDTSGSEMLFFDAPEHPEQYTEETQHPRSALVHEVYYFHPYLAVMLMFNFKSA
jgi:hypothetical protein